VEKTTLFSRSKGKTPGGNYPGDWRPPLRGRPRRNGGLWAGTLLAVLAVAAIGYWLLADLRSAAGPAAGAAAGNTAPAARPQPGRPAAAPAPEAARRSDRILSCEGKDGSVFYTNALTCAEADLENRVNVVPAPVAARPAASECLGVASSGRAQLFLAQCQQPFNQALELEPALVRAQDPLRSPQAREYCALITEGVNAGCMATSATFCYLHLCQQLREQP
jgi:hypothetical protein